VTNDQISVPKAIASQCLGGLFFSIFAGQPLIVVMTTAPLTLYVKGKILFFSEKNILILFFC
jgi:sodium borate transporter 11